MAVATKRDFVINYGLQTDNTGTSTGNTLNVDQVNDRVGVGTTPSYKFHVERGSAGAYAYMGGSSDGLRGLKFSSADDGTYLGGAHTIEIASTGGSLLFKDLNTNWLKLNGNGNVGVNNTNPAYKLDVTGDINFTGTLYKNGVEHVASRWTLTGSDIYRLSKVGINESNPQSQLAVNGYITESTDSGTTYWNVVTQQDIGSDPNQVPLNQYLGKLAFLDDFSPNGLRREGGSSDDVIVSSNGYLSIRDSFQDSSSDTPLYVGLTAIAQFAEAAGSTNEGVIRLTDQGSTDNRYHGIELRNRNFGDIRLLNHDQGITNGADFVIVIDDDNPGGIVERLRIKGNTGNIGVGTSSPGSPLSVQGSDNSVIAHFHGTTGTNTRGLQIGLATNITANHLVDLNAVGTYGTLTFSSNSNEKARITSAGLVGIGTSSPAALLHLSSGANTTLRLTDTAGSYSDIIYNESASVSQLILDADPTGSSTATGGTSIVLKTDGSTAMTIDSSQRVGIGTTSPGATLEVAGSARFFGGSGTDGMLVIGSTGASNDAVIIKYDNANDRLQFYNWGASAPNQNTFVIDNANSRVGIGTTSPGAALDILGPTSGDQLRISNSSSVHYQIGRDAASGALKFFGTQAAATGYIFDGAAGERARIDSSGRLGIGTSSPQRALHVSSAASEQVVLSSTSGSLAGIFFEPNGTTYTPFFGATGASLVSYTNGAERCRIDSSGNVGINDTNPDQKLVVAGNIRTTGSLYGPSNFIIDPSTVGDDTGTVEIKGNLVVQGTTTTINSTTVDLDHLSLGDNEVANFGNSNDLQIYHNGSNSYIDDAGTGNLIIGAANFQLMNVAHTENHITASDNGSVQIYYDAVQKFQTTLGGVRIGSSTAPIDINAYETLNNGTLSFEGSAGQLFSITNNLTSGSIFSVNDVSGIPSIDVDADGTVSLAEFGGNVGIGIANPATKLHVVGTIRMSAVPGTNNNASQPVLHQTADGDIDGGSSLTFNPAEDSLSVNGMWINQSTIRASATGPLALNTANASSTISLYVGTADIYSKGNFRPDADATYNLGTPSFRWANIYSADLQLSNEGSVNEVDGTWGQYTIQEGEEDLFLINRRSGKKYKFVLQEVG